METLLQVIGTLDSASRLPLYEQLQRTLRAAILDHKLPSDEPLPAERDMASIFGISRITVRRAFETLADEGLLIKRQGAGTYVRSYVEKNFSQLTSFSEDMQSRGFMPSSAWLDKSESVVSPVDSFNLGLTPGTPIYRFNRMRFADAVPMALEYCTVPAYALPGLESVDASLYEALAKSGYRPTRALQRLRAVLLTDEQAELLETLPNSAGLFVERRGFLADGRNIEISQSYYRGDTYDFIADLESAVPTESQKNISKRLHNTRDAGKR